MGEQKPLTLEELRRMDGKPVYWKDDGSYGIVCIDNTGEWVGVPFLKGRKNGENFEFHIKSRAMELYKIEPIKIDYLKWRAKWIGMPDDDGCTWLECSACEYDLDSTEEAHNFCPNCGMAMNNNAIKILEKRLTK